MADLHAFASMPAAPSRPRHRPVDAFDVAARTPEQAAPVVRRGALAIFDDPLELRRHDRRIALSPAELAIMALLVRRRRADHGCVATALREAGCRPSNLWVLTHRIRRKFAAEGAPDPIDTRNGWGLVLRVEPDIYGSVSLWIGETETSCRRLSML